MRKKPAIKVKFGFRVNHINDLPEIENFVNTSSTIPQLALGIPPITTQATDAIMRAKAKNAELIDVLVKAKHIQEELDNIMLEVSNVISNMQNNAVNYIGDDNVKASVLNATIETYNGHKTSNFPDRPDIKVLKDGKESGQIKITLIKKPKDAKNYQVRYTVKDNQGNPITVMSPTVFGSVYDLVLSGFNKAQEVTVEVRANNINGASPWSAPRSKLVN